MLEQNAIRRPFCLEIEPTEGCNLRCGFCGISAIPGGGKIWNHLSVELAGRLADQALRFCPNARVEFCGHGEPLLNPDCIEIHSIFRDRLSATQLQVTTNGVVFLGKWDQWLESLLDINVLVIDLYDPYGPRLREEIEANPGKWRITDFFRDGYNPWHNHGPKGNVIVFMDDLSRMDGKKVQRKIDNRAGNSTIIPSANKPLRKNCAFPFRRFSVRWDGRVHICCMDWGLEYCVGDVSKQSFEEVWFGPKYLAVRKMLSWKRRCFAPCCFCDYSGGTMKGLLPKLSEPTEQDFLIVKETNETSPRYNGRKPNVDSMLAKGDAIGQFF